MNETDQTADQLTAEILRGGGLHLDEKGKVAGGGMYRVEIIAQLFGVTVRRIQQLTQEGVLPTTETPEGRRYDLVLTIQRYVKYLSDKAYGKRATSEKEMELRERKLEAEAALKESQSELHQLRTDIAHGKYISLEEVSLDYARFFVTFKKFALSIPARVGGIITGFVDPLEVRGIEKDLQRDIQRLLEAFVVAGVTELPPSKKKGGTNGSAEA